MSQNKAATEATSLEASLISRPVSRSGTDLFKNKTTKNRTAYKIEPKALTETALEFVLELKALDAVVYDVRESSSIADYIIVASGTSGRHVKGIVDNVKEKLSSRNISPDRIEGDQDGEWVVMDYSNVIIHIFFEPKRQYFKLDELFKDQKKMELKDHLNTQVRALKTGMHSLV